MADSENTRPFYKCTIPGEWDVKRLDEIATVVRGSSPRPAGDPRYFNGSFMPWLTVASLTNTSDGQTTVTETEGHLTEEGAKQSRELKAGTLILSNSGATLGVAKLLGINCCANDGIAAFIDWDDKKADKLFALYFLNSRTKHFREVVAPGNGQPNLNTELIGIEHIPLPPLAEQKAIAHVLGLMDRAIEKNNRLIAQKELRKKWLMQNLLTGKKRLQGFTDEWSVCKLSDLFERVTRKNIAGCTNVVTISAQRGFVRQTEFFNKSVASETLDNYFLVHRGEYCYNKSYSNGYPWGATKRLKDADEAVVTTLYICFELKDSEAANGNFFEYFFEANLLDRGLTQIAHEGGRAHGLLNVTPSDFFSLKITIPSFEEQTAIAKVLQTADKEIALLKMRADKLREQKKGMMQQLLTGKMRLRTQ